MPLRNCCVCQRLCYGRRINYNPASMASPKPGKSEGGGTSGRRSSRLAIAIPVSVSGKDASDRAFKEMQEELVPEASELFRTTLGQMLLGQHGGTKGFSESEHTSAKKQR